MDRTDLSSTRPATDCESCSMIFERGCFGRTIWSSKIWMGSTSVSCSKIRVQVVRPMDVVAHLALPLARRDIHSDFVPIAPNGSTTTTVALGNHLKSRDDCRVNISGVDSLDCASASRGRGGSPRGRPPQRMMLPCIHHVAQTVRTLGLRARTPHSSSRSRGSPSTSVSMPS